MTAALTIGSRVIVTDLRTAETREGTVTKNTPDPADGALKYVNVRYDSGATVRVGVGFVRKIGDSA